MTANDPTDSEPGPADDPQRGLARKNRGIRSLSAVTY